MEGANRFFRQERRRPGALYETLEISRIQPREFGGRE